MIVAGALVAVILGGLAGLGLNRLAAWLLARDEAVIARSGVGDEAILPDAAVIARSGVSDEAILPDAAVIARSGVSDEAILPDARDCFGAAAPRNDGATVTPRAGRPTRLRELALVGATALVAAALWLRYGASWQLLPAAIGGLLLLLIAAIDLDRRLVLNEVVLAGAALAVLHAVLVGGWGGLLISLAGGGAGLGLFLLVAGLGRLVSGIGALGAGDIKLAGLLGLMFGFPTVIRCLLLGVICGGLVSGGLLLARRLDRKAMIPYAPFLAAGGIITLMG